MMPVHQLAKGGDPEPTKVASPPQFHYWLFPVIMQPWNCQGGRVRNRPSTIRQFWVPQFSAPWLCRWWSAVPPESDTYRMQLDSRRSRCRCVSFRDCPGG